MTYAAEAIFGFSYQALAGMRPFEDPLMMAFFLYPWILGFAMSIAFQKFKGSFKKTVWRMGKAFGFYTWLLAGIPSAFIVYTSMNYPIGFTINSLVGSLIYMVAAGIVLEKLAS